MDPASGLAADVSAFAVEDIDAVVAARASPRR
jgi:hypothetical protein